MFRQDKIYKEFRELVEMYGGTLEALPEESFKESGTGVNTCLAVIRK